MAKKKKQQTIPLTAEQALDIAKREVEPFWLRSPPLFFPVETTTKPILYPIHPSASSKPWFVFFADPTQFSGEAVFHIAREYYQRYASLQVGFLLVVKIRYEFLQDANAIEKLLRMHQLPFPAVIDVGDRIFKCMGNQPELPMLAFIVGGQAALIKSGHSWLEGTEQAIQQLLRKGDPGLATLPIYVPSLQLPLDVGAFEFLQAPKSPEYELRLTGEWTAEKDHIITRDPKATLRLKTKGTHFALVAKSLAEYPNYSRMSLVLNGQPLFESILGEDTSLDLEWGAVARIRSPRMYHVLQNLEPQTHELYSQFPMAHQTPIALWGVRFGRG